MLYRTLSTQNKKKLPQSQITEIVLPELDDRWYHLEANVAKSLSNHSLKMPLTWYLRYYLQYKIEYALHAKKKSKHILNSVFFIPNFTIDQYLQMKWINVTQGKKWHLLNLYICDKKDKIPSFQVQDEHDNQDQNADLKGFPTSHQLYSLFESISHQGSLCIIPTGAIWFRNKRVCWMPSCWSLSVLGLISVK